MSSESSFMELVGTSCKLPLFFPDMSSKARIKRPLLKRL